MAADRQGGCRPGAVTVGVLPAPVDPLSWLPIPILSSDHDDGSRPTGHDIDRHHGLFPKASVADLANRLEIGALVVGVLRSMWQVLPVGTHQRVHVNFGPSELPTSVHEVARAAIFGSAGYVPDVGAWCRADGSIRLGPLDHATRRQLSNSGTINPAMTTSSGIVTSFVMTYLSRYGLTTQERHEFVQWVDQAEGDERQQRLREVAQYAAAAAFGSMGDLFKSLHADGLLPRSRTPDITIFATRLALGQLDRDLPPVTAAAFYGELSIDEQG